MKKKYLHRPTDYDCRDNRMLGQSRTSVLDFVEKLAWSNLSVVVNVAVKCQIKSVMFCHLVWQVML